MKEAVAEEHEGKRKAELAWKIHRINWEKNRFIYDLMYVRKAISRELVRPGPAGAHAPRRTPQWRHRQRLRGCARPRAPARYSGLLRAAAATLSLP